MRCCSYRWVPLSLLTLTLAICGVLAAEDTKKTDKPAATESSWNDLASGDESTALRALLGLSSSPKEAVKVFEKKLLAVKVDAARVKKLIEQLDDEEFAKREEATRELEYLDRFVKPQLEKALESEKSIEVKKRIGDVLKRLPDEKKAQPPVLAGRRVSVMNINGKVQITIDGKQLDLEAMAKPQPAPPPNAQWQRAVKAVALLERIGSDDAVAILKRLADGEADARPTTEAKAALARMKK